MAQEHQTFKARNGASILTEIETAERVGTFPLLFVSGHLAIIHNERNPSTKDVHLVTNDGRRVQTTGQWWTAI